MPVEPWSIFPPEINARRLDGHAGGALQASAKYQQLAGKLATDAVTSINNVKDLALSNPGHVADALIASGTKQMNYIEGQAANAMGTAAQLAGVGQASMAARAMRIPDAIIQQNRALYHQATANAWWSPAAAAVAAAAAAAYASMWQVNALSGTAFDTAAVAGSQALPMVSPIPSLPGGVRGVPSSPKSLVPTSVIKDSPAISNALRDSQSAARQMITPVDGLRGGGLGSGRGMPQVAGNPGDLAARGGVPSLNPAVNPAANPALESYNSAGLPGSTHTTRSSLASMPSYSPSGSGMSGGMPMGAGMTGTGARSGLGSLSFNHGGSGGGSARVAGLGRSTGTRSGIGTGAGSGTGSGAGTGASGAGSPAASVRGGALGGSTGMHAEKALGGRMGPAYSGVNAADKSLTTVGNQTRAGTAGGMGPGMAGARRGGHGTDEHATQASYIAKDVSYESLEEKRAHDKKQRELFK